MSNISVVIPCIPKHLKYLDDLIISICNQTLLPREVIISLSDYSDNDSQKLQEYYNNDNQFTKLNITVLNKIEPSYAGENRNRGCNECKTKYVTFMDADDLMVPNKIETLLKLFTEYDMDAIIHTVGKNCTNELFNNTSLKEVKKNSTSSWLDHKLLGLTNIINHGHLTVKKNVFDYIKQDISLKTSEDTEFVRRIIENDMRIFLIDKNLSIYRPHLSSSK